jgi:hypothetical protein
MMIPSFLGKIIPAPCSKGVAALLVAALCALPAATPQKRAPAERAARSSAKSAKKKTAKSAARRTPAKKTAAKKTVSKRAASPAKKAAPAEQSQRVASAPPARTALAQLTRAYREDPAPARAAALERFASAHAGDPSGHLARLALGISAFEEKDFATAIAALKLARVPSLEDYAEYYLAAARIEGNEQPAVTGRELTGAHAGEVPSPLSAGAWLLEARALKLGDPAAAVRLLKWHYTELPSPRAMLCWRSAIRRRPTCRLPRTSSSASIINTPRASMERVRRQRCWH